MSKVPVSERALVGRINRALRDDDLMLRKNRPGGRAEQEMGRYFELNTRINGATQYHVDIEDYGRELGVLREWEELRDE